MIIFDTNKKYNSYGGVNMDIMNDKLIQICIQYWIEHITEI